MEPMWFTVESSNVSQIGYDTDNAVLYVRFNNGYLYAYYDVDKQVFFDMSAAESKGRFVHQVLKGSYYYERVE